MDDARAAVSELLGTSPHEIVFTGGGTESDNLAIRGAAEAQVPAKRRHLIASAIEHEAVIHTLKALAKRGWATTLLPVDASGIVKPAALEDAISDDTALVSVMHANNEIGTVQPIAELAQITHAHGALFHTDAVQSSARYPSTSPSWESTCSRSRPTSSTAPKAWGHSGSVGVLGSSQHSPAAARSGIAAPEPRTYLDRRPRRGGQTRPSQDRDGE